MKMVFLILLIPVFSQADKFVCAKYRQSIPASYTYHSKKEGTCKALCAAALENSGSACTKHGVNIKFQVIDDGLKNCGELPTSKNVACTVNIQCDVCVR